MLEILENQSLAKYTTFKIGGNAKYLALAKNHAQIIEAINFAKKENLPYVILGNGSNVLVSDDGFNGIVIKLSKMNEIFLDGNELTCQSGVLLSRIGNFCLENEKTGFERICAIPASVGGAVFMNAGAYGAEISDILLSSTYMDKNGNVIVIQKDEHNFAYRHSFYLKNPEYIILEAVFLVEDAEKEDIKAIMDDCKQKRMEKQPLEYPSAGSTFKRPEGYFAGKLIEDAGLKGYRVGGACVSLKHAGFVINDGNATCKDVENLIKDVQEQVFLKFNVKLECEIKKIGD
ncbi:MAG: UDP-N-acetylmuramate dehydrogenase [Clostridia bacterium]